jgi:hypothetical protein
MNLPPIDMTGRRIGRIDVIEQANARDNGAHWLCVCRDCHATFVRVGTRLRQAEADPERVARLHRCWGEGA